MTLNPKIVYLKPSCVESSFVRGLGVLRVRSKETQGDWTRKLQRRTTWRFRGLDIVNPNVLIKRDV